MPDHQRILVVSVAADEGELRRIREDLGADPVVLVAPTAEGRQVVDALAVVPQVEVLLAPVRFPPADRGHQLEVLVRSHALRDRFRDVVVVTDLATSTLLLRALAPDQLAVAGALTVVGLPRGDRPLAASRGVVSGLVAGVVAAAAQPALPFLTVPAVVASVGLALTILRPWRHLGRELLLAAAVALGVVFLVVATSGRFPGGW